MNRCIYLWIPSVFARASFPSLPFPLLCLSLPFPIIAFLLDFCWSCVWQCLVNYDFFCLKTSLCVWFVPRVVVVPVDSHPPLLPFDLRYRLILAQSGDEKWFGIRAEERPNACFPLCFFLILEISGRGPLFFTDSRLKRGNRGQGGANHLLSIDATPRLWRGSIDWSWNGRRLTKTNFCFPSDFQGEIWWGFWITI